MAKSESPGSQSQAPKGGSKGGKKKVKKNIATGIVHVQSTFNNTIVTITDVQGNVVVPNLTETDLVAGIPAAYRERLAEARASKRHVQPIEVAQAVAFAASRWADAITGQQIVLNLGEISYIDSGGLGTLVALHTTAHNAGGTIKLANLTRRVGDLLQVTKLLTVFDVHNSEYEALESFRKAA